jgi:hypothetical protein
MLYYQVLTNIPYILDFKCLVSILCRNTAAVRCQPVTVVSYVGTQRQSVASRLPVFFFLWTESSCFAYGTYQIASPDDFLLLVSSLPRGVDTARDWPLPGKSWLRSSQVVEIDRCLASWCSQLINHCLFIILNQIMWTLYFLNTFHLSSCRIILVLIY